MSSPITFISGTRKGIGLALVRRYLEQGHLVFGCSRQPSEYQHERYQHFRADVADETAIKEIFKEIRQKHKRLDNLINNAGIASMNHSLTTPMSTVKKVFETNTFGTFLLCREAAKVMQQNRYGRIVNFSTVAVPFHLEGEAIYAASKAAIVSLTQVLAFELAPFGITVNAVGPTPIETDLIRAVPKEKIEALIEKQAIKRMGVVADVLNAVDFFVSPSSGFVTGQTLYLGGV